MGHLDRVDVAEQIHAGDEIDDPHKITTGIQSSAALHKPSISTYQLQNVSLLFRAPNAFDLKGANSNFELLWKNELQNVHLASVQIESALDPELGLILQPESPLPLVALDQEEIPLKFDDMVPVDSHEMRGVSQHYWMGRKRPVPEAQRLPVDPFVSGK